MSFQLSSGKVYNKDQLNRCIFIHSDDLSEYPLFFLIQTPGLSKSVCSRKVDPRINFHINKLNFSAQCYLKLLLLHNDLPGHSTSCTACDLPCCSVFPINSFRSAASNLLVSPNINIITINIKAQCSRTIRTQCNG